MGDFTPGVERAKKAGYAIEVRPYEGTGEEQVAESLDVIAKKIRDGRLDPDVRGWVGDVLKAAGDPKSRAGKVQAILDAFRQATIYVSDPVGAEYIVAAGTTMCLRPGLCVRARDCIPEGTKLLRDDGPISIEHVRPGDRIWGRDTWTTVQAVWSKGVLPVDEILLATGACVRLTGDHKVYVWRERDAASGGRFVDGALVSELEEGDRLLRPERLPEGGDSRDNRVDVRSIARSVEEVPCWDITTEDHYVYLPEHDVTVSNCDDGVVAVGSAIMAAGIPAIVVKQNFGPGKQEHVLVEALMEDGNWLPADPSTNLAAGDKVPAVSEERIDPMDMVGSSGTSGPEIVTLGAVPAREWPRKIDGVWTVRKHGQWWKDQSGVGWVPVGTGEACCAECAAKDAAKAALAAPPAQKSGTGSEDDGGEGCSACEAWAKRHEAEIAAMGVSGASSGKASGPKLSLLARLRDGRLGLGADLPGTTVLANPLPIQPTSGSVGVGAVAVVALGLAAIGGVAWSLGRDSACAEGPRGRSRRRAA